MAIKIKLNCKYGNFIYNDCDYYIGKAIQEYGQFSESELEFYKQFLNKDCLCLDIGANMGALTVPIAQLSGEVIAFEPQRWVYYQLCSNIVINNLHNVNCQNVAVGKEKGEVFVPFLDYDSENNFGGLQLRNNNFAHNYVVPVITVDSLNLNHCDFMKIDVEKMEYDVLLGAEATIEKFKPVIFYEDNEDKDCELLLNSKGYKFHKFCFPGFDENNYFQNKSNYFQPPEVASFSVMAYHEERVIIN